MTKVEACNTSELSIHLDSPRSFLPGQTITGCVYRTSRWVTTETNISIALHGKCHTKLFSRDSYKCRGSVELFGQDGVREEISNGASHIPTTSRSDERENKWQFAIDIPTHPDAKSLGSHPLSKASYLPLSYAGQHAIPPSFELGNSGFTSPRPGSAVVEYYLEAVMMTSGSSKPVVARLPIQIRCASSPFPITDFDTKLHPRQTFTIASPSSAPLNSGDLYTSRPSIGHKISKALRSPKTPRLTFCLEISVPSVLQRGNPYHVPFEVRAVPQGTETTYCTAKAHHTLNIEKVTIALRSSSSIMGIASGALGPVPVVRDDQFMTKIILAEYMKPKNSKKIKDEGLLSKASLLDRGLSSDGYSLMLPIDEDTNSLDLGEILDLNLQQDHAGIDVPTFITYNIKRTYELEWKMNLEIGGETLKVKGRHPVLIMERTEQDSNLD